MFCILYSICPVSLDAPEAGGRQHRQTICIFLHMKEKMFQEMALPKASESGTNGNDDIS